MNPASQLAQPWSIPDPRKVDPDPNQTDIFNAPPEPKGPRFVMLFSWWRNASGSRKFAIVEKVTKNVGSKIRTIKVKLLEVEDSNPFYYDIDDFWRLVDDGKLVEMPHDALNRKPAIF